MKLNEWLNKNRARFGSEYEVLFAERVLPLVPELRLDAVSVQYPFQDTDRRQRYCDFVIQEKADVRIAIEIDGFDKRGTGQGMSHADFIDWQRRQAALTSQGWYVLRFANRDVRDEPKRCAEHISLLLKRSRGKANPTALSADEKRRLEELNKAQEQALTHLNKETSIMKHSITAFTAIILVLVSVIVWQSGAFSERRTDSAQAPTVHSAPAPLVAAPQVPALAPVQQASVPVVAHTATARTAGSAAARPASVEAGTTCDSPIPWQKAREHMGQTLAVVGPLMKVTQSQNVRGNPTWVDVGGVYHNVQRLMVVIWGDHAHEFPNVRPGRLEGRTVCVIGLIRAYKGAPQIELSTASQLRVVK